MKKIIVLDFGGQYTQNIARRIREFGVYSEILPYNASLDEILSDTVKGIILAGSPYSVYDNGPIVDVKVLDGSKPVLGICYGIQLITHIFGGNVTGATKKEYGPIELEILEQDPLFNRLEKKIQVWMSHGDKVEKLPVGFKAIAKTVNSNYAAIKSNDKLIFGVQFHPEVDHTEGGRIILSNFVYDVCDCKGGWIVQNYIEQAKDYIKKTVGQNDVIALVSGGIDSAVAATLVAQTPGIGKIYSLHIDNGLMRKNESDGVIKTLRKIGLENLIFVDATKEFLNELKGVTDPEEKRRIIGDVFIRIQERELRKLDLDKNTYLCQGTLYTDLIESGSGVGGYAARIKTHHNVASPLIMEKRTKGLIVEPNRWFFKDEVRKIGKELGLPDDLVKQHPFPGPGLAVRIVGEVTKEKLDSLREADAIFIDELKKYDLYDKIWQAFTVLTADNTIGVQGDERTCAYCVALRAVDSRDGMTANFHYFDRSFIEHVVTRIINEIKHINRVVLDVTPKPPATIEWL